jgi:hypothetical protein
MHRLVLTKSFVAALSVVLAVTTGLARTEKIWAQNLNDLIDTPLSIHTPAGEGHEPFDPRRVPQTGGGASRLLSGLNIKHA